MDSSTTIAFITDVHLDEQFPIEQGIDARANFEATLSDMKQLGVRRLIFGGDIGEVAAHAYFFSKLEEFDVDLMAGNHDRYALFRSYFTRGSDTEELFYVSDGEGYRLIVLDSSQNSLSEQQCAFLKASLETTLHPIVCVHHPVLSIPTVVDTMFALQNREAVQEILFASKRSLSVLCGHYHMNDERTERNVRQITTRALSYQVKKDSEILEFEQSGFGYRILELSSTGIESRLRDL